MLLKHPCAYVLAASLSVGTTGGVLAQTGPSPSRPAPSVDTGAAGTGSFPVRERSEPNATGAVGSPAVNPPGNPPGTIQPNADAAAAAGASGKNPCFPGESGQKVGNANPSGSASRC
jgi:hypothetical protein